MNVRAFRLRPIAEFLRRSLSSPLGWGALASIPGLALAGPSGENVVGGAAAINRPNATHTLVDQSTQNAIVNWQSFSVNSEEYVIFNQPGATSTILNRVVGSQQSTILGQIQANGRVFLVNPQGILFGQGAKVDVGSLAASTLDISNNDFMAGKYVFARASNAVDGATVENAGDIKVGDGGYVVLAGDYASNGGVISARLGSVVLAAGNKMTLDLSNDGLVSFAVDEATVSALAGANNSGDVLADGGQIIMTAKVANDLVATAVNNDGLLQAHRIVEQGGEIYLSAAGGNIVQSGTIDATAESNFAGGTVALLGDENITLTPGSEINANGSGTGNGGVVNVIADGTLAVQRDSNINAIAGASGSKGGAVEVSGHGSLILRGDVTVGAGGDIVIDPAILNLSAGTDPQLSYGGTGGTDFVGTQWVETRLDADTNVTLRASDEINNDAGGTSIVSTGFGMLTLEIASGSGSRNPTGDINLAGFEIDINGSFSALAGTASGNVNLGKVSAQNVVITAGGTGGSVTLDTGGITANSGDVNVNALGGSITIGTPMLAGDVNASDATVIIRMNAALGITVNGNLRAMATSSDGGSADVRLAAGLNIQVGDATALGSNNFATVRFDGGNIVVNNATAITGAMDQAQVVLLGPNVTAGSAMAVGGTAFVTLIVDNDILVTNDLIATGATQARVFASAGRDLNFRDVTTSAGPGGNALFSFEALRNVTGRDIIGSGRRVLIQTIGATTQNIGLRNISATAGSSSARADLTVVNDIAFSGGASATGMGSARLNLSAGNDILVANDLIANGASNAAIDADAGRHLNFRDATAMANSGDANINLMAGGNITAGRDMTASASNGSYGGAAANITAMAQNIMGRDAIAYTDFGNARVDFTAANNITVRNVEAEIGSVSSSGVGNADVVFTGGRNVAVNILEVQAGTSGGNAFADVSGLNVAINDLFVLASTSGEAIGSINATNDITIGDAAAINEGSGVTALEFNAGRDIRINGAVNVDAQSDAEYLTNAGRNNTQIGDVMITGASAFGTHEFGNTGMFGRHAVTAGPGGSAFARFGGPSGLNGNNATFTNQIVAKGGNFGAIGVRVKQSIRTVNAGLLYATNRVSLLVSDNGTTTIDAKTKAPVVEIKNIGMTPNVRLDNRAFIGSSAIDFGPGGTMLKSTNLLATGPLTIKGSFLADNLAVGVTNGSVTFLDSVFITGNNPFLPTAPDLALFRILGLNGIAAPGHGPNVQILASRGINITNPFVVGGPNPFTKMFSNGPFNVSGLTGNGNSFLGVFSPTNLGQDIAFNNFPSSLAVIPAFGTTAFSAFPTFSGLPNTNSSTVVIGELGPGGIPLLNGDLDIASSGGTIDFGNKNLFFITQGSVTGGVDDVSTTGVVNIIGLAKANIFAVPIVSEVSDDGGGEDEDDDDDDNEDLALGDGDGGDDDGEVTEESDSSGMECSA